MNNNELRAREFVCMTLDATRTFLIHCMAEFATYKNALAKDSPAMTNLLEMEVAMDKIMETYPPKSDFHEMAHAYFVQLQYCRHCFGITVSTDLAIEKHHAPASDN